jgi:hypothetical protein
VLSDRLARFGKPPPGSTLTTEMSSVWVNASSLVYRLGQLPPHVQELCRDATDEIKECIDDLDTFTMSLSAASASEPEPEPEPESESESAFALALESASALAFESPSGSDPALVDEWARDIEQVIDVAMSESPTSQLERAKSNVTVIRRLLGAARR